MSTKVNNQLQYYIFQIPDFKPKYTQFTFYMNPNYVLSL